VSDVPAGAFGPMLPKAFLTPGVASFTDFLGDLAPDLVRGRLAAAAAGAAGPGMGATGLPGDRLAPHGTTIIALAYRDGVLVAGDRRATMGNMIAQRDIEKVFPAGEHAAVGIAGTAGVAVEMVRLFQVEIEHYEKIEGVTLSLDGKANMLARMVRENLGAALQGIAALPLLAGYDLDAAEGTAPGRIWSYDLVGGRYEEHGYHAIGSGSVFAKGALKKTYTSDLDRAGALRRGVEALYDAADDDSATGGPDATRGLYPTVALVTEHGYETVAESEVAEVAAAVVADRTGTSGPQGA